MTNHESGGVKNDQQVNQLDVVRCYLGAKIRGTGMATGYSL